MIEFLVAGYCVLAINASDCRTNVMKCIDEHNNTKYIESMWMDVPDEKMSVESFEECTR